jgi:peptide/nickel transport system permease protein
MIPTLVGITFLIFMLIAMSPGGIGAALRAQGGTVQADGGNQAVQEAYLEDRYGLDDPVVMQYLRWLHRVSPIKLGTRAQTLPNGEVIAPPRGVKDPPAWRWFDTSLPTPPGAKAPEIAESDEARDRAYRTANSAYARARQTLVAERTTLLLALGTFAKATGHAEVVGREGKPDVDALEEITPNKSAPEWPALEAQWRRTRAAYEVALASRAELNAVYGARLFPEVGFAVIPGVLSLGPPDLGQSFARGTPVLDLIQRALPVTLLLNLIAFPIIYLIAVPFGMLAAVRKGKWQDTFLGGLFVAFWSIPTVWAGVMCLGYLCSRQYFNLFPTGGIGSKESGDMLFLPSMGADGFERGFVLDALWHIALPVFCLVYGGFAVLSKQTRAAMLENFSADYVRTAKAKGVAGRDVIFQHVFRNSLLPLITMFATIFPAMLAGSVVIERIFSVPGMGSMVIEAIYLRDREVLLANTLMIAAVNLLALLLADILYAMCDPRISYK